MGRRRINKIGFVVLGVFVAAFLFTFLVQKFQDSNEVDAANMAAFDPGYIISDYQMSNYNSMNEGQIQSFLSSKGRCGNTNFSGVGTRVGHFSDSTPPTTWHVVNGHTVCLAEENMNGESAAHIIWQAAQDYRINPQVLIVLLQKETGLITDPIPNSWDYQRATGYGCPDNAPCSAQYYGFKNQVRKAAELFRTVLDNGYSKYPVGGAWVQWSTHSECGSGWVNIKNRATSALYRYTPYQPNAAALASSYGSGDYCSQYGNRNFYSYFEDWFGGIKNSQASTRIADGVYQISVASSGNMVIDVDGGSTENGANIQLYEANGTDAQKWEITYNSNTDDYNITNVLSRKVVDLNNASIDNGTNIKLWEKNGSCAQRWKILRTSGNIVKFISACSFKTIDIKDGTIQNSTNIQLWEDNGSKAQQWRLSPIEDTPSGLYSISSAVSGERVMDIAGGARGSNNGTNIQSWGRNDTPAQRWYIEKGSDGYYVIKNKQTGKVLDIKSGEVRNGANIQLWESNNTCAQKWQILRIGDSYTFISACSYKVIDLASASTSKGANIQTYDANNSKAQKWYLNLLNIVENGEYTISSTLSEDMVLDVFGGSDKNGTNVQIYKSNNTPAQKWQVNYDESKDFYSIFNNGTGRMLDVTNAGTLNNTNVQIWERNNTCAQKWTVAKVEDAYVFYSGCSERVLDVAGGSMLNGTNIQIYEANGTKAQKWKMDKIE